MPDGPCTLHFLFIRYSFSFTEQTFSGSKIQRLVWVFCLLLPTWNADALLRILSNHSTDRRCWAAISNLPAFCKVLFNVHFVSKNGGKFFLLFYCQISLPCLDSLILSKCQHYYPPCWSVWTCKCLSWPFAVPSPSPAVQLATFNLKVIKSLWR